MSRAQASSQTIQTRFVKDAIQRAQSGNAFQLCRAQASSQLASLPTAKLRINLERAKEIGGKICECVKTYKKLAPQSFLYLQYIYFSTYNFHVIDHIIF